MCSNAELRFVVNFTLWLEKVRRNKPTNENSTKSRNSFRVKVGGVGIEGMMTLSKVGAHATRKASWNLAGVGGILHQRKKKREKEILGSKHED